MSYLQLLNIDYDLNQKMLKTIYEIREKQIDEALKKNKYGSQVQIENVISELKNITQNLTPPWLSFYDFSRVLNFMTSNKDTLIVYNERYYSNFKANLISIIKKEEKEREEKIDKYFNDNFLFNQSFKNQNEF